MVNDTYLFISELMSSYSRRRTDKLFSIAQTRQWALNFTYLLYTCEYECPA